MNNLRITTAELAQLCGVSQGTVDRALNNRRGISEETKEKILKTATQYGFRSAVGNRKCSDPKPRQIGVIVFNLNNEYFCKLITEIEVACRRLGYTTLVMFTNYDKKYEIESIRRMYSIGVEGIILAAVNSGPEFLNYLKAFKIPIIAVGNDVDPEPHTETESVAGVCTGEENNFVSYVGIDDFVAMKDVTEYVLQKGYKPLSIFLRPSSMTMLMLKRDGLRVFCLQFRSSSLILSSQILIRYKTLILVTPLSYVLPIIMP